MCQEKEPVQLRYMVLTHRMNSLCALVTGRQSSMELVHPLHAIGITRDMIRALERMGLITYQEGESPNPSNIPSGIPAKRRRAVFASDEATQRKMEEIHLFFKNFLRPTFGFRGVPLQFDLENCRTMDDYHALANSVVINLYTHNGSFPAVEFKAQAEKVLGPIQWR